MKPEPICPKCGCKRFRCIGSFGHYTDDGGQFHAIADYVECMQCGEMWDRGVES